MVSWRVPGSLARDVGALPGSFSRGSGGKQDEKRQLTGHLQCSSTWLRASSTAPHYPGILPLPGFAHISHAN
ncbi:hypothetical protein M408DRAFT_157066 [Serendipita vermifera MAFF 305830]|uniref:Uncharacterized protein n=1 Tax=Serendipita vermifera MAFF 305830 TaxID=933852 RepID=A0A0C2XXJ1_SERVB|nr:hypothetical protein M408DRAFT_157066 [Serendipita vermifera MAFF 305830]